MTGSLTIIDGIDGSGKSVVLDYLKANLPEENETIFDLVKWQKENEDSSIFLPTFEEYSDANYLFSAEPTYRGIGQVIRLEMIRKGKNYTAKEVAQAFSLDRFVLYNMVFLPAIKEGIHIVQDRSVTSSIAYQPAQAEINKDNLTLEYVLSLAGNEFALKHAPNLIFILLGDPYILLERVTGRTKKDDAVFENIHYLQKITENYKSDWFKEIFESRGSTIVYIDAEQSEKEVKQKVLETYLDFYKI
jgi:dTMP kinase